MTNPVDNPEAYDVIVLAGLESPGICKFPPPVREIGWDQQTGKSGERGETVQTGTKGAEFEVEFYLRKDPSSGLDEFAAWDSFRDITLRTSVKPGDPKALDIYHPSLEGLQISSVVVKTFQNPAPDGKGGGMAKVAFLEYLPTKPKGAGGKPKGSKSAKDGAGGAADEVDPNQAYKDAVQAEVDKYNEPAKPLW